jgi:hypothetical protein
MKTVQELTTFLEDNGFNVWQSTDVEKGQIDAEVEIWTDGGVDMTMCLSPFTETELREYVENFDVDEEIELHRQDKRYCNAFTLKESLKDFENHKNFLDNLIEKLDGTFEENRTIEIQHLIKNQREINNGIKAEIAEWFKNLYGVDTNILLNDVFTLTHTEFGVEYLRYDSENGLCFVDADENILYCDDCEINDLIYAFEGRKSWTI